MPSTSVSRHKRLLVLLIVLCITTLCMGQPLAQLRLRSISTYSTCQQALLDTSAVSNPESFASTSNGGSGSQFASNTGVCNSLGQDQETLVIRYSLRQQSVAGVDNLAFTITSIPSPGSTVDGASLSADSNTFTCEGVASGDSCRLLKEPFSFSVDSSIATIQYDMTRRPTQYFYAYVILYNTDFATNGQCNATLCSNGVPFASSVVTCSNVQQAGWVQLTNVNDFSSSCNTPICPGRSASRPYYFGPDSSSASSVGGSCPIIYCKIPKTVLGGSKDSWTGMTVGVQTPICTLWDINPSGVRVMNARVKITRYQYAVASDSAPTPTSIEYLQLSNSQGGAYIQSASVPLVAQMLPVESSFGSVPPAEDGGIMTCSSDPSLFNVVNDMPPLDPGNPNPHPKTLVYNPWDYQKDSSSNTGVGDAVATGCVVPAAACRAFFPSGATPKSFWYKVQSRDMYQYNGNGCNQQGTLPVELTNPTIASKICAASARSTQGCTKAVSGQCVPNYLQFNELNNPLSETPCMIDQRFETFLQTTTNTPFDQRESWPGVTNLPSTYDVLAPDWWTNGQLLMTSTLGDNTVSSDIIIITSAQFLGEIIAVSTGQLLNQSMLCNAVEGGPASVAVLVQNTGNLPGLYFVTLNLTVGPKGNASLISYETPTTEISDGVNVLTVVGTSIGVDVGQNARVQFNYRYNGPLVNDLRATVELWVLASESVNGINGYQRLDSVTVSCTITIGQVFQSRNLTLGNITSNTNDAYTCEWYSVIYWVCIGHYRQLWMFPTNITLYWPLFLMSIALVPACILAFFKLSAQKKKSEQKMRQQAEITATTLLSGLPGSPS